MIYIPAGNLTKDVVSTMSIAVAVGNFDGLHAGHLKVIDVLREAGRERGLLTAVISFFPHPHTVLRGGTCQHLFTRDEKMELLRGVGMDYYIEYPFDLQIAGLSAREFFAGVLVQKLNTRAVVIGEGFRFGANAEGNTDSLLKLGREFDVDIRTVAHCGTGIADEKISSSEIKRLISKKEFGKASTYLTRDYFVTLKDGVAESEKILPPDGEYAVKIMRKGTTYNGKASIEGGGISVASDNGDNITGDMRLVFIKPL